jgi:hypothetical protein
VFCIYLRTNSDLCHLQHKLIGFYNRDEKCLQRGTDLAFKYSSLGFVFKGLSLLNFSRFQDPDYIAIVMNNEMARTWKRGA